MMLTEQWQLSGIHQLLFVLLTFLDVPYDIWAS